MRVRTLKEAARFVDEAGFAYVFPDNRIPLPSLWGAVCGKPERPMDPDDWGWTKPVALTWDLKDALGEKRLAWFGRYFRGKGSLISLEMLPALFRLVGATDTASVSPEGREVCERLRNVGPMSTFHLRMSLRLSGSRDNARFAKVTVELYRKFLICNAGVDDSETQWPAAVIGLFARRYPDAVKAAARLSEEEALRRVLAKAPELKPRSLAALFGLPRSAAFATIARA